MGVQARERQDELFDLRTEKRQLLVALAFALCGGPLEKREARLTLEEFANDPATAKIVLLILDSAPDRLNDYEDVRAAAMLNAVPPHHQVPALIRQVA